MDTTQFLVYLLIMSGSTYLIRAVPFAAIKNKINNRFINSFLYYIPYAVLTAMTFPAILYSTQSVISAAAGFATAILFALKTKSLTIVAVAACSAVFIAEYLMTMFGQILC